MKKLKLMILMLGFVYATAFGSHALAQFSADYRFCRPLLLLIEGGARSVPDSIIGGFFEDIRHDYLFNSNISGIKAEVIQGKDYWDGLNYFISSDVEELRRFIELGNYYPIVIVGHSMGAHIAWELADSLPTDLLVTLDGISFLTWEQYIPDVPDGLIYVGPRIKNNHPRHPKDTLEWRNVWVNFDSLGPNWSDEPRADIDYSIGDYTHYDVEEMWRKEDSKYGSAAEAVDRVLRVCHRSEPLKRERLERTPRDYRPSK